MFISFSSLDNAEKFKDYLSSKHPKIKFLLEKENDGCLFSLHIIIFRENLLLIFAERKPSVVFIVTSTAS